MRDLIKRLRLDINTDEFARNVYQRQCEYVGPQHEDYCVDMLREMFDSFEKDMKQAADEIERLQAQYEDDAHNIANLIDERNLAERQRDAALKVLNEWILDMQIRSASLSEYAETFEEAVHLKGLCEKYRAEADQIRAMKQ